MQKKYKVTFDASFAFTPTAGLSQEARFIVSMFSESSLIQISCLFMNLHLNRAARSAEEFIQSYSEHNSYVGWWTRFSIFQVIARTFFPRLYKLDCHTSFNPLWRSSFSYSLPSNKMESLSNLDYFFSTYNPAIALEFQDRTIFSPSAKIPEDTDFFITHAQKHINVKAKNCILITRYVDSLPIRCVDTADRPLSLLLFRSYVKHIRSKRIIVCASETEKNMLTHIEPRIHERNLFTIYPPIQEFKNHRIPQSGIFRILQNHSRAFDYTTSTETPINKSALTYLIAISTIEPRKNYLSMIQAWKKFREFSQKDIKLVIVGKYGWGNKKIMRIIKQHVQLGNIFHLTDVPKKDLEILLSCAEASIFTSLDEGFGCAPLEAMSCKCPTISSDIPTHREVYGDATLYFDPYSINDIVKKIEIILDSSKKSKILRENLIKKGLERVKRYSPETLLPQWEKLFDELKKRKEQGKIYY